MEKVLIIHEDEACVLWCTIREQLRVGKWNPLDDESWSNLLFLKALEKKLGDYMDAGADGPDVVSIDSVKSRSVGL